MIARSALTVKIVIVLFFNEVFMENKKIFEIIVYDDSTVDVIYDGKLLPCSSIDFHADAENDVCVPNVKIQLLPTVKM